MIGVAFQEASALKQTWGFEWLSLGLHGEPLGEDFPLPVGYPPRSFCQTRLDQALRLLGGGLYMTS